MERDNRLGEFLRARREGLPPQDFGLPQYGGRRVPGLRRQEVAMLANVSTDYYMRLEQGREQHPSAQVLEALAHALKLNPDAVNYMFQAAGLVSDFQPTSGIEQVSPELLQLLDHMADMPAYITGRANDILSMNKLAMALYQGFASPSNLLRIAFLDPGADVFYRDLDLVKRHLVSNLRASDGDFVNDLRVRAIVDELSVQSADFRQLWARHEVRRKTHDDKRFHHPQVGDLSLHYEVFSINSAPGQRLVTYQAKPGSASARALSKLDSPTARPAPRRQHEAARRRVGSGT